MRTRDGGLPYITGELSPLTQAILTVILLTEE